MASIWLLILLVGQVWTLPAFINIGAIFDNDDKVLEVAFINAIKRINNMREILPRSELIAQIKHLSSEDSFLTSNLVCSLMNIGVAAIFGPQGRESSINVQSMCDALEVPHIDTRWNYNWEGRSSKSYSINLFPHGPTLGKAYVDLVRLWKWEKYAVIYQDNEALVKLNDLFKSPPRTNLKIKLLQLPAEGDYHKILREIKKTDFFNIVVDCDQESVYKVLKQAQQIGIMTDRHHYLITSLDLDTIVLDDFKFGGTNISSFRLVDPTRFRVKSIVESMRRTNINLTGDAHFQLKTEAALIFDAVYLFAQALHDMASGQYIEFKPVDCQTNDPWVHGQSLTNYMKLGYLEGLTGIVLLDTNGYRSQFDLEIMELHEKGLLKIGNWSSRYKDKQLIGLNISRTINAPPGDELSLKRKFLNITTLLTDPYIMEKLTPEKLTGNNRFEGFCVDILEEAARILEFNYSLYVVEDRSYGSKNETTGKWNGIIGELQNKKADLAIGDITITHIREEVVDFSTPFMNLGISIMFRKPTPAPPNLLSFLSPFSNTVWIVMGITYMGVSAILFLVARLTPYEWDNPYPCIQDPDEVSNSFTLLNSLWFTIGSLMQQGSDIAPKASSTRSIAGIWWFFTLIMISSYTANLAAFLTVENLISPIKDVKDLAKQTKIKYGCVSTGSTKRFFQDSKIQLYSEMWAAMAQYSNGPDSVFVQNNDEGLKKVKKGDYAYFIESTSNEFLVERHCELTQIGGLLDSKGYGIAMRKNSPYRNSLSATILKLQEQGVLSKLKTKWWKQKRGGGMCKDSAGAPIQALGLPNVGGIFVVLLGGVVLAILVAIVEFWWKTKQVPRSQRESIIKAMINELILAVRCKGTKEVIKTKDEEPPSRFSLNDEYVYS